MSGIPMSASSFLLIYTVMWLVPVAMYVVLFSVGSGLGPREARTIHSISGKPARKEGSHPVRQGLRARLSKHGERNIAFECLLAMSAVAAATTALIFGLIVGDLQIRSQRPLGVAYTWTWINNADVRAQTGAPFQQAWSVARLPRVRWQACLILMGGAAVLIGGIAFSLLKMQRPGLSASDRRLVKQYEAFHAELVRIETEKLLEQSTDSEEPYPHHETHPESPGQDQGQLTSHLPGSTPLFAELDLTIFQTVWAELRRFVWTVTKEEHTRRTESNASKPSRQHRRD
jgi:hypothetical protein